MTFQKKYIPFTTLKVSDPDEKELFVDSLKRVMEHGQFLNGKEVIDFEVKAAKYLNVDYGIGVSSGTGALYLALKSLGVGVGDEVIVPCLSWLSTALAVQEIGAIAVFSDIKNNLSIDPSSVKKLINKNTKAIISVDYMGIPADIESLAGFNIPIIEDSSQAFGSQDKGEYCGTRGTIGCFSLNPMKQLGALGDAGLIVTKEKSLNDKLKILRYCGMADRCTNIESSLNFRLDALQASFLSVRLERYPETIKIRQRLYRLYASLLPKDVSLVEIDKSISPYSVTICCEDRDRLITFLDNSNIETKVQHSPLMCDQPIFKDSTKDIKKGLVLVDKILSLPFYTDMSVEDIKIVCEKVREFYEG